MKIKTVDQARNEFEEAFTAEIDALKLFDAANSIEWDATRRVRSGLDGQAEFNVEHKRACRMRTAAGRALCKAKLRQQKIDNWIENH